MVFDVQGSDAPFMAGQGKYLPCPDVDLLRSRGLLNAHWRLSCYQQALPGKTPTGTACLQPQGKEEMKPLSAITLQVDRDKKRLTITQLLQAIP